MAYEEVVTKQFRAKDGSLHGSVSAAQSYDHHRRQEELAREVVDIIDNAAWMDYHLGPFCGHEYHQSKDDDYKRRSRVEAIADIVVAKWDDLKKIMDSIEYQR